MDAARRRRLPCALWAVHLFLVLVSHPHAGVADTVRTPSQVPLPIDAPVVAPLPVATPITNARAPASASQDSPRVRHVGDSKPPSATPSTPTTQPVAGRLHLPTVEAPTSKTHHPQFDHSVRRDRGVIIALHDGALALGLSLIKELRCLGNDELIQVYHCFPDELSPESRDALLLNETRLEIVDVCSYYVEMKAMSTATATKFRNWWIKPLAMLHTDVREVLLLDADAIPLRDPAVLRTLPGYVRTGTTFFYDRAILHTNFFNADVKGERDVQVLRRWVETFDYAAFNLTGPAPSSHLLHSLAYSRQTCHEMDSSMVVLDKSRAGKALEVLWYLIASKRFELEFSWGDKESFWLAYEFAHVEYFFSPWGVGVVSSSTNRDMDEHPETLCGNMAQFVPVEDESPELLYVNGKALLKPLPHGVVESTRVTKNRKYNPKPTHVTPRQPRKPRVPNAHSNRFPPECLVGMGSTPLPVQFNRHLLRRRTFYMAIEAGLLAAVNRCDLF